MSTHPRRAVERQAAVIYRMSPKRREELKDLAHSKGVTVQNLLDSLVWDDPLDHEKGVGIRGQQEFPLAS